MDADITMLAGWEDEARYGDALLGRFAPRIAQARQFALERRTLLVRASNGKDVDISLGALPFEAERIRRAPSVEFAPGAVLPCCTAEDLLILKAFAGRPRDGRFFCSDRGRRGGCGRTHSILLTGLLRRRQLTAPRLWKFFYFILRGLSRRAAGPGERLRDRHSWGCGANRPR